MTALLTDELERGPEMKTPRELIREFLEGAPLDVALEVVSQMIREEHDHRGDYISKAWLLMAYQSADKAALAYRGQEYAKSNGRAS